MKWFVRYYVKTLSPWAKEPRDPLPLSCEACLGNLSKLCELFQYGVSLYNIAQIPKKYHSVIPLRHWFLSHRRIHLHIYWLTVFRVSTYNLFWGKLYETTRSFWDKARQIVVRKESKWIWNARFWFMSENSPSPYAFSPSVVEWRE